MESTERIETIEVNEVADAVNGLLEICPEIQDSEVIIETYTIDSGEELGEHKDSQPIIRCPHCNKVYATIGSLRRHVQSIHGLDYVEVNGLKGKIKCMYDSECTASFTRNLPYRQHLTHVHGVKIEVVMKQFRTMEDFLAWKTVEERETQSQFNKFEKVYNTKKGMGDMKKRSYVCCRSGRRFVKGNKKKTMKIGTYCPAKMEILFNSQRVNLKYFKTHVGHGLLHEIYKTSLKKRMQSAVRRQKRVYNQLKAEVKAKVEKFLEKLAQDSYHVEFLKVLSAKLDSVFDPDDVKTDIDPRPAQQTHADTSSGNDIAVLGENFKNSNLIDHGYVFRSGRPSRKEKDPPPAVSGNSSRPIVVFASKENRDSRVHPPQLVNIAMDSDSKNTVPPNDRKMVDSDSSPVVIVGDCGDSVPTQKFPVIIVKTDNDNIIADQRLQPLDSHTAGVKIGELNSVNNSGILCGNVISCQHKAIAPLTTGSLCIKRNLLHSTLPSDDKKRILEALWNSYKNS